MRYTLLVLKQFMCHFEWCQTIFSSVHSVKNLWRHFTENRPCCFMVNMTWAHFLCQATRWLCGLLARVTSQS